MKSRQLCCQDFRPDSFEISLQERQEGIPDATKTMNCGPFVTFVPQKSRDAKSAEGLEA
jgi:hypothetical protein